MDAVEAGAERSGAGAGGTENLDQSVNLIAA